MDAIVSGFVFRERLLEQLKGADIQGRVGKHAEQPQSQPSVCRAQASVGPHLFGSLDQKGISFWSTLDDLALETEFEGIDRVHAKLRRHATDATGHEFRDGADFCRIVMAFESG